MTASADLLRRAAAVLRERAAKATPGPWSADPTGTVCADADLHPDGEGGEVLPEGGPMEVAECYRNERSGERGDNAAHIALMHPPVALALAAAMDEVAKAVRFGGDVQHRLGYGELIVVAREVLRELEAGA